MAEEDRAEGLELVLASGHGYKVEIFVAGLLNIGTFKYMAPECSSGDYSPKSDYYSFGVLLYEMFEGIDSTPQSFGTSSEVCFSDKTPAKIQEFIRDCLVRDPEERCNFECYSDEDYDHLLFSALYRLVVEDLGLDENELMSIERLLEQIEKDEEEILANEGEVY